MPKAYTPEATRAQLVGAVSQALDVLTGGEGDDDGDEEDEAD